MLYLNLPGDRLAVILTGRLAGGDATLNGERHI